jgi:hypothetical protein
MALELSVPALSEQSAVPAEVDPKAVQALLAALPFAKPVHAAQAILPPLHALNRTRIASDVRVQLLELYRHALLDIVQGLATQYYNAALPLSGKAKEAAHLVKQLLIELAYGYKLALLNRSKGLFGSSKRLPLMVQRAMDTLSRQLIAAYQTYMPQPQSLWSELHQLYVFAVQQKLHKQQANGIDAVYKQALLLYLSDPHHLVPGDVDRVHDYLARHADLAELQLLIEQQGDEGVFLVNLVADEPPEPLAKRKANVAESSILLVTRQLTARLETQLARLQENETPGKLDLPPAALDAHYQDLLAHLLRQWKNAPRRVFPRTARQGEIEVCVGLGNLHYFLNGEGHYRPSMQTEAMEITLGSRASAVSARVQEMSGVSAPWAIVNESAGGLALAKSSEAAAGLRLGELIGLKSGKSGQWSIAAVRWACLDGDDELSIGSQLLAPQARAVLVRDENGGQSQALLLPAIEALKQPASLIALPGSYAPARVLELEDRDGVRRLLATRLVERTTSFERFQFSAL